MEDVLSTKLTSRERELILKYGYPFEEIERQLRAARTNASEVVLIGSSSSGCLMANVRADQVAAVKGLSLPVGSLVSHPPTTGVFPGNYRPPGSTG